MGCPIPVTAHFDILFVFTVRLKGFLLIYLIAILDFLSAHLSNLQKTKFCFNIDFLEILIELCQSKNRSFIPIFIEQQQKMFAELRNLSKVC